MRSVALAFLVATIPAMAGQPASCEKWTLAGYSIGMTKTEAEAVRGGKWTTNYGFKELRARVDDRTRVSVWIDPNGNVSRVFLQEKRPPASIKLRLIRRFGPPLADALPVGVEFIPFVGHGRMMDSLWEAPECSTALVFRIVMASTSDEIAWDDSGVFLSWYDPSLQ